MALQSYEKETISTAEPEVECDDSIIDVLSGWVRKKSIQIEDLSCFRKFLDIKGWLGL